MNILFYFNKKQTNDLYYCDDVFEILPARQFFASGFRFKTVYALLLSGKLFDNLKFVLLYVMYEHVLSMQIFHFAENIFDMVHFHQEFKFNPSSIILHKKIRIYIYAYINICNNTYIVR